MLEIKSGSVSQWVSQWQGHLMSCSGQLKKYRKAVRWCASLTWLIWLIWLFWMIWLMKLIYNNIFRSNQISRSFRFYEICHQDNQVRHNISGLQIFWDISPKPQYLMVADFMRYHTRSQYLMGPDFVRYCTKNSTSHGWRLREI